MNTETKEETKTFPKVDSVAAIKRLPVGTKLYLVASLMGPSHPTERIVKQVRSADIIMCVSDLTSKNHGKESYLGLRNVRVEATANGFRIYEKDNNNLCAEYVFELKPCTCLFRHPRTSDERETVKKALDQARGIGDTTGIQVALGQLTGKCLSDQES